MRRKLVSHIPVIIIHVLREIIRGGKKTLKAGGDGRRAGSDVNKSSRSRSVDIVQDESVRDTKYHCILYITLEVCRKILRLGIHEPSDPSYLAPVARV